MIYTNDASGEKPRRDYHTDWEGIGILIPIETFIPSSSIVKNSRLLKTPFCFTLSWSKLQNRKSLGSKPFNSVLSCFARLESTLFSALEFFKIENFCSDSLLTGVSLV